MNKDAVVRFLLTHAERRWVDRQAEARGLSMSELIRRCLRLSDALTSSQWRWWEREAQGRGMTPEELISQAAGEFIESLQG